ncbi:unnamed protein product, partial [Prunus brigantina]
GILGDQGPFPAVAQVKNPYSQPSPFLSFRPSFMVNFDEERNWYPCWFEGWLPACQYLLVSWIFCLKTCSFPPNSLVHVVFQAPFVALSLNQMLRLFAASHF